MKKYSLFCLVSMLALTMMLTGCSIDHNDFGYYEVTSMDCYGITADKDDLTTLGIDPSSISLYLAADGSGYFNFMGAESDLTWNDGQITMDGEYMIYDLTDGQITMTTTEGEIIFERASDEPA